MKRIYLAFFILVLTAANSLSNGQRTYDNDTRMGFYWASASGSVHHYNVYISVDGGPAMLTDTTASAPTPANPYFIDGQAGKTYRIQVEAEDAEGNLSPRSDWSGPVMCTPGDVNHDGMVDLIDLISVARDWLLKDSLADINDDGVVSEGDLELVKNYWDRIYYVADTGGD